MTSLAPDAADLAAPPEVPGYRVQRRIGGGASSVVWAAAPRATGSQVAVKVVRAGPAADRELAVLRAVRHPHVLSLRDAVPLADGRLALVTDLLDGGSLASVVAARGRLRPGEVVTVVAPLAQALSELHAAGIQHGDLASGNVLFDRGGRPYLSDLGTVRLTGVARQEVFGTPGFLDPVLLDGAPAGPASDVYGLGALAWFALCGEPPPTPMCRPSLASAAPQAPAELVAAVQSALDPSPTSRPTPLELARALHAAVSAEPVWRPGGSPVDGGLTRRVAAQVLADPDDRAPRHRLHRTRRVRARPVSVACSAVALAVAVGGAVVLLDGQAESSAAATAPPVGSAAASRATTSAEQAPTLAMLVGLASSRAGAFGRAPGRCGVRAAPGLAGSVPGSAADLQDQALLADLAARCLSYRGLTLVPRRATVLTSGSDRATVDVVVDESAYDVVDEAGTALRHVAALPERRSRLSLRRTERGWQVAAVSPSPTGQPRPASGAGK
ncbi:protein kinase domain-containing protein [Angustibacter sp. McL0619]|uniref:serine/threonine-protein kinase n=1 Tax=Angustibacter sp. McL0619 TaxID=3415676 RepID=UPI003CED99E4